MFEQNSWVSPVVRSFLDHPLFSGSHWDHCYCCVCCSVCNQSWNSRCEGSWRLYVFPWASIPAGRLLSYVHFHWQTYSELKLRRFPALWYSLTLCISCILANLFQILLGFNFDLTIGPWIKKLNQPLVLVTVVSGIQVAVSVSWLIFNPPIPQEIKVRKTILYQCEMTSFGYFSAMLVYNGCLGLTCFLFGFKGRQLPDLYKNASLITVSMMLFMVIWIIFLPLYLTMSGKYKPAIEGAAILTSCFSILFSHLASKCFIILFRKELNKESAITEYIWKHYEQKGLPVSGTQHWFAKK